MALNLVTSPIKTINATLSNVNAALSQLPYTFSRQDYAVASVADVGGLAELTITGVDVTAQIPVASRIFVQITTIYSASTVVTAVAFAGGDTTILTTLPFNGTAIGYLNLLTGIRVDYNVLIIPLAEDGITRLTDIVFRFQTLADGELFVDLSGFIVPLTEELVQSFNYRISYQEFYNGGSQGVPVVTGIVQAILSSRQQMSLGGSNLMQKLLAVNGEGNILTRFKVGQIARSWIRTVSQIIDVNLTARTGSVGARFEFQSLDHNLQAIGSPVLSPVATEIGIDEQEIPEEVKNGAFVRVRGVNDIGDAALTNAIRFRIVPDCKNPVLVQWINSDGASEQHLFQINQSVTIGSQEGVVFNRPIVEDYQTANDTIGRRVTTTTQRVTVGADNLSLDQLKALHEIKTSNVVFIQIDSTNTRQVRVRVLDSLETEYSTKFGGLAFSLQITIELPDNFDLFEALADFEYILIDSNDDELVDSDDAKLVTI